MQLHESLNWSLHSTDFPIWLQVLGSCQERRTQNQCSRQCMWNDEVRRTTEQWSLLAIVQARHLSLTSHTARLPDGNNVWCYTLVVVHARNEWMTEWHWLPELQCHHSRGCNTVQLEEQKQNIPQFHQYTSTASYKPTLSHLLIKSTIFIKSTGTKCKYTAVSGKAIKSITELLDQKVCLIV